MTVLPILASAARMWIHGDYVSQTYFWRSAPAGIDLATLFLGNPGAWLTGAATSRAYSWLGIDGVERVAWAGPSVLALCAAAIIRAPSRSSARRWLIVAAVFLLWAVGPRLTAFGRDLQILMPATLIRYLPVLSNARIPSRAIAGAIWPSRVLSAIGFATLVNRRQTRAAALLGALLVIDYLPAPAAIFTVDHPGVYDVAADTRGAGRPLRAAVRTARRVWRDRPIRHAGPVLPDATRPPDCRRLRREASSVRA